MSEQDSIDLYALGEWAWKRAIFLIGHMPEKAIQLMKSNRWRAYLERFDTECKDVLRSALLRRLEEIRFENASVVLPDEYQIMLLCKAENEAREWVARVFLCRSWSPHDELLSSSGEQGERNIDL